MTRAAIAGLKIASPAATARIARASCSWPRALEHVAARAGAQRGEDRVVVLEHRQDEHAHVRCRRAATRRVASIPPMPGHLQVHHHRRRAQLDARPRAPRSPFSASPTTSMSRPSSDSSSTRSPARNTGWSSAISSADAARRSWRRRAAERALDPGAAAGRRSIVHVPPSSAARSRIEPQADAGSVAVGQAAAVVLRSRTREPPPSAASRDAAACARRRGARRWPAPPARCAARPPRPRPAAAAARPARRARRTAPGRSAPSKRSRARAIAPTRPSSSSAGGRSS